MTTSKNKAGELPDFPLSLGVKSVKYIRQLPGIKAVKELNLDVFPQFVLPKHDQ